MFFSIVVHIGSELNDFFNIGSLIIKGKTLKYFWFVSLIVDTTIDISFHDNCFPCCCSARNPKSVSSSHYLLLTRNWKVDLLLFLLLFLQFSDWRRLRCYNFIDQLNSEYFSVFLDEFAASNIFLLVIILRRMEFPDQLIMECVQLIHFCFS